MPVADAHAGPADPIRALTHMMIDADRLDAERREHAAEAPFAAAHVQRDAEAPVPHTPDHGLVEYELATKVAIGADIGDPAGSRFLPTVGHGSPVAIVAAAESTNS